MARARGIRAGKAFIEVGVDDRTIRGLKRIRQRLATFGASIRNVGMRVGAAGIAMAVPFAFAAVAFARFEQRMARVKALTSPTAKEFAQLNARAKELGETTVYSATQVAEAMAFFALAGVSVKDMLTLIEPALDLAAAGMLEVGEAADIALGVLRGMGMKVDQAARVMDVLAKASTTAMTDIRMLGEGLAYVGPQAVDAGLAIEDITAAVQILSDAKMQASQAGTQLRMVLRSLLAPTAAGSDELEKLGIAIADGNQDAVPLVAIIAQLETALSGMGTQARAASLAKIFPARAVSAISALLRRGSEALYEYSDALRASEGHASKIADIQLDTLSGDAIILKSAVEGLAIAIGASLGGALRKVAQAASKAVRAATGWVRENRGLVLAAAAAVASTIALGGALVAVGIGVQVLGFALGGLISLLVAVKAAVMAVAAIGAAMLTPVGLVVTGLALIVGSILVYTGIAGKALNWLKAKFTELKNWVGGVVKGIATALKAGDVEAAARILWGALRVVWLTGALALVKVWDSLTVFVTKAWRKLSGGMLETVEYVRYGVSVAWTELTSAMVKAWAWATGKMESIWLKMQNWLSNQWLTLMGFFGTITEAQVEDAKRMGRELLAGDLAEVEAEADARLLASEKGRQKDREIAEAAHVARLEKIWEKRVGALGGGKRQRKLAEDLKKAHAELNELLEEQAKHTKDAADAGEKEKGAAKDRARYAIPGLGALAKISPAGAFSPFAAAALGMRGPLERIGVAVEKSEVHLKAIRRQQDEGERLN